MFAAITLCTALCAQMPGPCWETSLGTNLGLSDDSLSVGNALGFPFALPGGGSTTSIDVSSNGFVWLVSGSSTASGCCNGFSADLLNNPPRIAPVWMDLNPSAGGGVYFNTFPGRAVVTWDRVPEFSAGGSNSVQLQLYADGSFSIALKALTLPGSHTLLVGVSQGGNAADPGEIDYTAQLPFPSATPTVYEQFNTGADVRDVVDLTMYFLPASSGYLVIPVRPCSPASTESYGRGCPLPPIVYELFTAAQPNDLSGSSFLWTPNGVGGWTVSRCTTSCWDPNFSNNLALGDDVLSPGHALGFAFPMPGSTTGTTSTIDVSSNGWVGLVSGSFTSSELGESITGLLSGAERVAVLWDDLNPGTGGGVYFDTFPGRAVITWNQVPEYSATGSNSAQLQLFANGNMIVSYQPGNTLSDGMLGYSSGRATLDPGAVDFTVRVPFDTGSGGSPIALGLPAGTLPRLGTALPFTASQLPTAAVATFLNLGFRRLAIDLTPAGAPACTLFASTEGTALMPMTGSAASLTLTVPNNTALLGGTMYAQSLVLAPGLNPLNVVASNGLRVTVGL